MGLFGNKATFSKFFAKLKQQSGSGNSATTETEPPRQETEQAPPVQPKTEPKKRTSWIDELNDPNSGVHAALAKLAKSPEKKEPEIPTFNVSVTVRHEHVDHEPVGELSILDFGKPAGELGCFLNYSNYKITGNDTQGKRRMKFRTGINEQQAIKTAMNEGLLAPFKTEVIEYDTPTERQLKYAEDLGVFVPDGATKCDVSCLISRALGEDSLESPQPEIVALAFGLGTQFSACIGADGLIAAIIHSADDKNRAALYAYAVYQSLCDRVFGNMLEDPKVDRFYEFAAMAIETPTLLQSIKNRAVSDFLKPHKGTNAYKAAVAFLVGDTL